MAWRWRRRRRRENIHEKDATKRVRARKMGDKGEKGVLASRSYLAERENRTGNVEGRKGRRGPSFFHRNRETRSASQSQQ